jgi:hypothetical protein
MRRVTRQRWLFVPHFLLGAAGCSDANKHTYGQAAVATVAAVGVVGLHRALTRDCWARCRPGYLCNEESGLCELGECLPGCEFGTHCVRDALGHYRCTSDLGNHQVRSSLRATPAGSAVGASDAGLPSDAGSPSDAAFASDAAPTNDAATLDTGAPSSLLD